MLFIYQKKAFFLFSINGHFTLYTYRNINHLKYLENLRPSFLRRSLKKLMGVNFQFSWTLFEGRQLLLKKFFLMNKSSTEL